MTHQVQNKQRRRFLQTSGGLAAAAAIPNVALAAKPKKGGTLRMGISGGATTDTLDPALTTDYFMQNLGATIRNELTEIDHTSTVVPSLAESWEASDGAKKWVFKIRRGVEFHNGRTLTPKDVVASINHHRGEDSNSAAKPYFESVTDIKIDGDNVVFLLESGSADFPFLISDYHMGIMPENPDGSVDWQSGIGSGAYVLQDYEPGVRAAAKKFANYWKSDRGYFDAIQYTNIADAVARTQALTTGQIDMMNRCDLKTLHLLARNENIKVEEVTGTQHYTAPMITTNAPFDDNHVRLALKYAVDRDELVKKILYGHGLPGNDHPIAPSNPYHDSSIPQRAYDPDQARHHLKKAGVDKLKVKLSAADAAFTGAVDAAVLWQESAAKCGIDIEVVREPNDGYWSNVWLRKDWSMCFWSGRATEDLMFSVAYAQGVPWNDSFWSHDRFNKLLVQARAETKSNLRREMYSEMQNIVRDEGGVPNLMFANYVWATAANVANNGKLSTTWPADGHKNTERWWFA